MPFTLADFVRLRPFAFHVTARENLPRLRASGHLRTAASLMRSAGRLELLGLRREGAVVLALPDGPIVLKDQRPLIAANVELARGWSLAEFVEYLNGFTYFWPGSDRGPIGPGQRLLGRYEADSPAVIRIPTTDLLAANPALAPEFCPFNSGAPRYNAGKPARRGPRLFTPAEHFPRNAGDVVELGFRGDVVLPESARVRTLEGWASLFTSAG